MKQVTIVLLFSLSAIFIGCNEANKQEISKAHSDNVVQKRGLTPPPSIPTYKPKETK